MAAPVEIRDHAALRELLGDPMEIAIKKALPKLDKYARAFIERASFLTLGTASANGRADVSPRGDQPAFVLVLDDSTLFIPERPGNKRYDTLTNIIDNPEVGILFFVPGFEDMLRVNGRAVLVVDDDLLERCSVKGKAPKIGIKVEIEEAFLHCAKAIRRARLWDAAMHFDRSELPSLGKIILEQMAAPECPPTETEVATIDELVEENYRTELY